MSDNDAIFCSYDELFTTHTAKACINLVIHLAYLYREHGN